jgi:hypothetical protein
MPLVEEKDAPKFQRDLANFLINLPKDTREYLAENKFPPLLISGIVLCGLQKEFQTLESWKDLPHAPR